MTTLKGAMRSYGAAVRRIEREQQRQAREAARRFKEQQKFQEIADARQAVQDWEDYIEMIQSVHRNCTDYIDWTRIKGTTAPKEPILNRANEELAKSKLESFKPSFFDKILGTTEKKISKLNEQVEKSKKADEKEYNQKLKEYKEELQNWNELQEIARGVEDKEPEAYKRVLEYFNPFSDIGELGVQARFSFESDFVDIDLKVNSDEIVPNYELKQTTTGKLSKKNMPKGRFNELYQDHICSSSIRVAREIFAYLPVKKARINALTNILNGATGHLEEQPILSVIFVPDTIDRLNLATIDPSDSMQNFVHNMKFSKTGGFSPVLKVELEE